MRSSETKSTTTSQSIQAKTKDSNGPFFNKEGGGSVLNNVSNEPRFFDNHSSNSNQETPFFSRPFVQTKLTIGQPGDKYENEADAMADQVVQRLTENENPSPPSFLISNSDNTLQNSTTNNTTAIDSCTVNSLHHQIQGKCAECEAEEKEQKSQEEEPLMMKPVFESDFPPMQEEGFRLRPNEDRISKETLINRSRTASLTSPHENLESRLRSSKGGGTPLPENTRTQMEGAFGADFSGVRVHTDSSSVQMNKELGAHAFAHGSDIYFNAGKFNPNQSNGKRLLAHELTHTLQQKGGARPTKEKIQRWPNWVSNAAGWVKDTASSAAGSVVAGAEWVGGQVADGARWVGGKVAAGAGWVGDQISAGAQWIIDRIRGAIDTGMDFLSGKWESIKEFGSNCFDNIKNGFGGLIHFITTPITNFIAGLTGMNADILESSWNLLKSGSNALWTGINSVINGVLRVGETIWNAVPGFIERIFNSISGLFRNPVFGLLPNWIKKELHAIYNGLRALWNQVSSFWKNLWKNLIQVIQEILAAVQHFIDNIINFGIRSVISMVRSLKEVYEYLTELFTDPQATIEPLLNNISDKLNSEVPGQANALGIQVSQENYSGSSHEASNNLSIQKSGLDNVEDRSTATFQEVVEGISYYITRAWNSLDLKKMLWDTVVNLFWPPATIKAIFGEFNQLWNFEWAHTLDSLYTPRNFFENPIGCLHDIWSNYLILLEFPLALWRRINNVIGLLMGYIAIIIILVEAGIGAVAGAAAGGVGAIPGALLGAKAGLATVAAIGEGLMLSYLLAEGISVQVIIVRLFTARQSCLKRQRDIMTSVSSFITMAVALTLQFLMALLSGLVSMIANFIKGISKGVPVTPPIQRPPIQQPAVPGGGNVAPVPTRQVPGQNPPRNPSPVEIPGGGDVIPFPNRQPPAQPAPVPDRIAAKFEENESSASHSRTLLEDDNPSLQSTIGSDLNQNAIIPLTGVPHSGNSNLQAALEDGLDPEKCKEEECTNIRIPPNIKRWGGMYRNPTANIDVLSQITNQRESEGYQHEQDYFGNNIAGFKYIIYSDKTLMHIVREGQEVSTNDELHSEQRIISRLEEIIRGESPKHVLFVDQIITERSPCSGCYDLIRNNPSSKVLTKRSDVFYFTKYIRNRTTMARELKHQYCDT
jgi:hypothetical protein